MILIHILVASAHWCEDPVLGIDAEVTFSENTEAAWIPRQNTIKSTIMEAGQSQILPGRRHRASCSTSVLWFGT